MARRVDLHPDALAEAEAAVAWYAARSPRAAAAFAHELDLAVDLIAEAPERWPTYVEETRRVLLRHFPYLVVYRVSADRILVLAVAHGRRRPGYWVGRLV